MHSEHFVSFSLWSVIYLQHLGSTLYDKALKSPPEIRKLEMAQSIRLYRQSLDICRSTLGNSHALTVQAMNNLGNLLHARGLLMPKFIAGRGPNRRRDAQIAEGADLLREALEVCRSKHGEWHIETLIGASNLGSALRTLGNEKERPGYTPEHLASIQSEANGLIKSAIEGIAVQWKAPQLENQPRARAALLDGLADLDQEGKAAIDSLGPWDDKTERLMYVKM